MEHGAKSYLIQAQRYQPIPTLISMLSNYRKRVNKLMEAVGETWGNRPLGTVKIEFQKVHFFSIFGV